MRTFYTFFTQPRYRFISISAFFLVVFSGCFLTQLLPLSPIYFAVLLGVCCLIFSFYYKRLPRDRIFYYIPFAILVIYHWINIIFFQVNIKDIIVLSFFYLYYIIIDLVLYQATRKELLSILKYYFSFNIILFIIDLVIRIYYAQSAEIPKWMEGSHLLRFYLYKPNSIMFRDSNGAAMIILSVLSVLTFIKKEKIFKNKFSFEFFILIILLIGAFSRAAIISYLFLVLYITFIYKRNVIINMFMFLLMICFFYLLFQFVNKDGSGITKIMIFEGTFEYIRKADNLSLLIGNGPNLSPLILGGFAHNLYSTYLIDYGLIGSYLLFIVYLSIFIDIRKYFFYIAIPYFLSSFSWAPLAIPYIFCSFSLIKHIDRTNQMK